MWTLFPLGQRWPLHQFYHSLLFLRLWSCQSLHFISHTLLQRPILRELFLRLSHQHIHKFSVLEAFLMLWILLVLGDLWRRKELVFGWVEFVLRLCWKDNPDAVGKWVRKAVEKAFEPRITLGKGLWTRKPYRSILDRITLLTQRTRSRRHTRRRPPRSCPNPRIDPNLCRLFLQRAHVRVKPIGNLTSWLLHLQLGVGFDSTQELLGVSLQVYFHALRYPVYLHGRWLCAILQRLIH